MDAQPLLELIGAVRKRQDLVLVGIGGRGAAGKTRLARTIPEAQIVSTDEFWDGEGFDIPRLAREVVQPLSQGREARFASYDWASRMSRGMRVVEPAGIVVVEGVCALHRLLRDAYAVRAWVDAPAGVRLARGVARDGEESRSTWVDVWMPSEDRYVERDDPVACAHLVVDNGRDDGWPAVSGRGSATGLRFAAESGLERGRGRPERERVPVDGDDRDDLPDGR